jgi:hypothetical protein
MAKTAVIGNDGSISTGVFNQASDDATHNALINYFEVSFPRVVTNVTGFAHTLQRNRLGLMSIDGMLRGMPLFDAASTSPGVKDRVSTGSSVTLTVATGCTYAFTAAFSNFRFTSDKQGNAEFEAQFVNGDSDTLTETWDES